MNGMSGSKTVGTVVGVTNPREFYFAVTPGEVQLQDIVCVDMKANEADKESENTVRVWAKIVEIERINPLFPGEAAQELSTQRISAFDTVVSLSREMITAKCIVLGREAARGNTFELKPLTYPLQPASSVYLGDPSMVENLIAGDIPDYRKLRIGHLRGHSEFPAYIDMQAVVARHLGVLAATGAGKTVTVRKILEEMAFKTQYPILIFDPHSDYIGLKNIDELKDRVDIYSPMLYLADEETENIVSLVRDLSGEELSSPQESLLTGVIELVKESWSANKWKKESLIFRSIYPFVERKYCMNLDTHHFFCLEEIVRTLEKIRHGDQNSWNQLKSELDNLQLGTAFEAKNSYRPVKRQLSKAARAYRIIKEKSKSRLESIEGAKPLPRVSEIANIIQKGKIAIVSLEGYGAHSATIVANLMRQLQDLRLQSKIPRFLTVVEEAHNFVPGASENPVPSLEILRDIATEGRKYGMGLVLISQRPSRINSTVLSQCNSFIILRIINPADQKFVQDIVESLGEDDAKLLPDLATGEALLTGECTKFPVLASIEMPRSVAKHEEEDFVKDFVKHSVEQ